ncbi:MAG: GatB/YqeY domain-containing protein [Pseudomonadota bacterium]|nr:GatB/YqeY domain-containing protein [Pseudomonadota bacterium]
MSLKQRIQDDMKTALRARDKDRLAALRLILAAIQQREVDERITLDDAQVTAVLDRLLKQRRESIAQFQAAGRSDLAARETFEAEVIQSYLPRALSDAEIDALIDQAVAASGAQSVKDMGRVMARLKEQVQGRADMAAVSRQVKARLGG